MHWAGLNWPDLVLGLFRGTIDCEKPDSKDSWHWAVLKDQLWKEHGKSVADAAPYLPTSFDRPPRNPAEKISSGYKAWEYILYLIGLAPALLDGILPYEEWRHFCKGVSVIRSFQQYHISVDQIVESHQLACEYAKEFEEMYFQGMPERIHFVRQSIHAMTHLAPECIRIGPPALHSQWPIERTIGNLGQEIKSHSQPYANLSERSLRRCQVNALKAMFPDLDPETKELPRGAVDLGDGFALLRARDEHGHRLLDDEGTTIRAFLESVNGPQRGALSVVRWARLQLPNGQIARSAWREKKRPLYKVRMARNVKIRRTEEVGIGEVLFYFRAEITGEPVAFALIDWYSEPDEEFLRESYGTVWSCGHGGGEHLSVIPAKAILSVVSMVPHTLAPRASERYRADCYFLVEKPGLDVAHLRGYRQQDAAAED
ncbi:hypothetical protein C8R45DRAFT_829746 [Mycena sanguinolenta]|nr:hypothetical protein C8R45DRAFT_829746 [Mycena sanguinolenta]